MKKQTIRNCTKCDLNKPLADFYYHRGRKRYMNSCKSCNSASCLKYQRNKKTSQDIDFLLRSRATQIKRHKKNTNIPVESNLFQVLKKCWDSQDGKCYYTGIVMTLDGSKYQEDYYLTVDRKVPALGYVDGNVALCCNCINRIKSSYTLEQVKMWIGMIILT